ncbi:hypothetical protein PS659_03299 [Pseudomonas fluorescens]|uniref:Transmembrane protein n=2 Tax=Pseudomonas fluorescens TaxID=294 RepID=A0A5E6U2D9_PSEFL|nr:hypothetical protein PS659_03299 [Pseudomonas fluorescens]
MSGITPQLADSIYSWSHTFLVIGAVLALVGTMGAYWSGGIREKFADERIALNEVETARAKRDAAEANLAQLKLKAELAWRVVTPPQAEVLMTDLRGTGMEVWLTFVGQDPESSHYRAYLNTALMMSGIRTHFFSGYASAVGLQLRGGTDIERNLIISAFSKAQIPLMTSDERSQFGESVVEIIVGSKPPPQLN